jgi:L-ascorbate metabolism protein UlaG (beta-lactamase superfamily)
MAQSGLRRYPAALRRSLRLPNPGLASAHGSSADFSNVETGGLWLGHASTLLRVAGSTILTDPVLSSRIGVRVGSLTLGLDRLRPPPMDLHSLPPIDVVLLSHAHFDHLDRPTLQRLANPRTTVITAHRTTRLVPAGFGRVIELDWGQQFTIAGVTYAAIRPAHWGARRWLDATRGYNSYLIRGADRRVFFAGDTAFTTSFRDLGPVDLAIMGIGAYDPWIHAHASPEEAWAMANAMRARCIMPVHHSTFELSDEHVDEPMERLLEVARHETDRVVAHEPGKLWTPDMGA